MKFLNLFGPLDYALLALIAALTVWLGVEWSHVSAVRVELAHSQARVAQAEKDLADYRATVAETARLLQASNDRNHIAQLNQVLKAQDAAKLREAALRDDLARAADERQRLLVAIRRATAPRRDPVPGTPADAKPEPANPVADVLEQCTETVLDLARAADQHASDLRTMIEAWPKAASE